MPFYMNNPSVLMLRVLLEIKKIAIFAKRQQIDMAFYKR